MPSSENEEKHHLPHALPSTEAIDVQDSYRPSEAPYARTSIPWVAVLAARRKFDREFIQGVASEDAVQQPEMSYHEAVDIWVRNPDLEPEQKLSIEGKWHLKSIKWVFNLSKKTLLSTAGKELVIEPMIMGMEFAQYLDTLKEHIASKGELEYIKSVIQQLQSALLMIQEALLAEPESKSINIPKPKQSILELLENRKNAGPKQRFKTTNEL